MPLQCVWVPVCVRVLYVCAHVKQKKTESTGELVEGQTE